MKLKNYLLLLLLFSSNLIFAQNNNLQKTVEWNGYAQVRAYSNFNNNTGFMLRRLKLWVKSTPDFSDHWSYKFKTTITSLHQEEFFLEDAKASYQTGKFSFDFGQFVPQYSLQRFQSDYKLPIIERATAINCLIPDGTLGVRDIGIQANFTTKNKMLKTYAGVFNGYGIKEYRFDNQGFMLTHKTEIAIPISDKSLNFGYSVQYRKAENLKIPKVLPDTVLFSGNDFRYNVFAMFKTEKFRLQAEYLSAYFNGKMANGWYVLSAINVKKSQFVFSYENYKDLIETTNDNAFYHIGYNYSFKKYKTKLFFDNTFQFQNNKIDNYIASLQLQLFFN